METMNSIRCLGSKATKRLLRFFIIVQNFNSKNAIGIILLAAFFPLSSCKQESNCHDEMISILEQYYHEPYSHRNRMYPKVEIPNTNSRALVPFNIRSETRLCKCLKFDLLMKLGQESEAIKILEDFSKEKDKAEQHVRS